MKKFMIFLAIALPVSFFFEYIANTIGDGTLFQNQNWFVFFFLWYGFWQAMTYLVLHKKPLWCAALIWAFLGPILEIIVFRRINIIVDPIIYAVLFTVPLILHRLFAR